MSEEHPFENDKALVEYCVAAMFSCSINEVFMDQMRSLYDFIMASEDKHPEMRSTEALRLHITESIDEAIAMSPHEAPEGFDMEEFSKCFSAVLWCKRVGDFVDHSHQQLDMMASLTNLIDQIVNHDFRQENV